jgi:hypothetical protein
MTTWAAEGYVGRLIEVASLADTIVYVASDERYNDEVPTQFLHMLVRAGKAVVVVLTKMRPSDAPSFIDHFRQEILGRLPKLPSGETPAVPVVSLPQLTMEERGDPGGLGARYRITLLNQILVQCESADKARARTVANAAKYLTAAGSSLVEVARRDLAELDAWKGAVLAGRVRFEERYRREYLSGEQFRRFDRYREQLTELLELPGAGRMLGGLIWALRTPYRWMRNSVYGLMVRPDTLNLSEQTVLHESLKSWLDGLQAEALRRAGTHALWKQVSARFDSELAPRARDRFTNDFRSFELKESVDLEEAGRALVAALENNPALLHTLRGGKFVLDLVVIGSVIYFTWPPGWLLLLIPIGVSATHQFAELATRGVAEGARLRVRSHRESLVSTTLTSPMAEWLAEWPSTGGTSFEKLQQVLRRVPELIQQMNDRVREKLSALTQLPPPRPEEASQLASPIDPRAANEARA